MNAPGFCSMVAIRAKRALILVWQKLLIPPRTSVHVLGIVAVMKLNFVSRFSILPNFIRNMIWKACGTYARIGILGFFFIRPRRILTPGVGVVWVKTGNTRVAFSVIVSHYGFAHVHVLSSAIQTDELPLSSVAGSVGNLMPRGPLWDLIRGARRVDMFEHPHASRVWVSVNVSAAGELEVVLMIETKIPLDPTNLGFDDESYNSLTAAIAAFVATSEHFDKAVIVPVSEVSGAAQVGIEGHHLAGWRFSVQETNFDEMEVNVIDVHHPHFREAKERALRLFSPGSVIIGSFPLSEKMLQARHPYGASEKWIPLKATPGKPSFVSKSAGELPPNSVGTN
jgi:hypothetical protein